jgi:hypothetical protein
MSSLSIGSEMDMPILFLACSLLALLLLAGYVIACGGINAAIAAFPTPQSRSGKK